MKKYVSRVAAVVLAVAGVPFASAITIDGDLSDWGVDPFSGTPTTNTGDWTPGSGVSYIEEDLTANGGFVGPGVGGQNFDIEALYSFVDGNTLYVAFVTGFDIGGETVSGVDYSVGSVFIDFGSNAEYDLAFDLQSNSNVGGSVNAWAMPDGNVAPTNWTHVTVGAHEVESDPFRVVADETPNDASGAADFGYADNAWGPGANAAAGDHNVYEFAYDLSDYGDLLSQQGDGSYVVHWTMSCGNDVLDLHVPAGTVSMVPVPSALGLGLIGIAGVVARKRKQTNA